MPQERLRTEDRKREGKERGKGAWSQEKVEKKDRKAIKTTFLPVFAGIVLHNQNLSYTFAAKIQEGISFVGNSKDYRKNIYAL